MTKIDIFSGFLGAGKTTLIKKLIKEVYQGEKLVLIENEFGEIGIDGGFLAEAGIQINEMNSGCICCSLIGDFAKALNKVINEYEPDRILIEPSGVGKLSDVKKAVENANTQGAVLNGFTTVVDANKCKMHMKNFGEFFNDQIANAGCIILSHTDNISEQKLEDCIALIKQHNDSAVIVSTPWDKISGDQMLEAIERTNTIGDELSELVEHHKHHGHHHHHHDGEECHCHEHHDHEEHDHHHHHHHDGEECHCHEHHDHEEHEHHHHHHHDGEECHCHEHHDHEEHEHHHHHHHDGEECHCHEHHDHEEHDHHHHHHHADEVFVSYGAETARRFNADTLKGVLDGFESSDTFGMVLRAKGIVESDDGRWIHFDYIPGESDVRFGGASVIGRLCIIGSDLNKSALEKALGVTLN